MPLRRGLAVVLAGGGLLGGCTLQGSSRTVAYYHVDFPVPYTVQAGGYASPDGDAAGNRHYSVSINLRTARPFIFIFPDGYRAPSRGIAAADLSAHFAPVEPDAAGRLRSARRRGSLPRLDVISFTLGADGLAGHLWLYACRSRFPGILATEDATQVFDFPLREDELRALVGPPSRSGTGWGGLAIDCDGP